MSTYHLSSCIVFWIHVFPWLCMLIIMSQTIGKLPCGDGCATSIQQALILTVIALLFAIIVAIWFTLPNCAKNAIVNQPHVQFPERTDSHSSQSSYTG